MGLSYYENVKILIIRPISLGPSVCVKGHACHCVQVNAWVLNSDKPQFGLSSTAHEWRGLRSGPQAPNLGLLAYSNYAHLTDIF